jgi:hypothetical protein
MIMNENGITVLGEYKVAEENRKDFLDLLPRIKQSLEKLGAEGITFFEGTDQPGLFVEEFIVPDMETYTRLKKARYEETTSVWAQQHTYVPGGKIKLHLWAFSKLDY